MNFVVSSDLFFEWQFLFYDLNIRTALGHRRALWKIVHGLLASLQTPFHVLGGVCTRRVIGALLVNMGRVRVRMHKPRSTRGSSGIDFSGLLDRWRGNLVTHTTNIHELRDFLNCAISYRGNSSHDGDLLVRCSSVLEDAL
jgi:hypothetical protein